MDNTQALLESDETVPSKFLQFFENVGVLINVTIQNHIEVWDITQKQLSHVQILQKEITSFSVIQQSFYMYIGDCLGNISVFRLDKDSYHLLRMQYHIPFLESHGKATEVEDDTAVVYALPQPMAESRRVLIIFRDGLIILWSIPESKVLFATGGNMLHVMRQEPKKVASACWACPFGSKVVVGYCSGEIFLWSVPKSSDLETSLVTTNKQLSGTQNVPLLKLNLCYKMDKVPIFSLRWVLADGRASRLYVNGVSEVGPRNSFQVILLNENTESRTIKLTLPLPEACLGMEIVSSFTERNKHKQNALVLLLKSGRLCFYDDLEIENYLLKCQSKSSPPIPRQVMAKLPYSVSKITIAKFITAGFSSYDVEGHMLSTKEYPSFLPINMKETDGSCTSSTHSDSFTKAKNLYVTGHLDGAINFWDASCPLLLPILSIKQQIEDGRCSSDSPVTALYFDISSQILVSGYQSGLVHTFLFQTAPSTSQNILSIQRKGTAKKGCNYTVNNVKLNGAIVTINMNCSTRHLAIGTDKGYVYIVEMEGTNALYQKHFPSELYPGIISLQFKNCNLNGSEKDVLLVAMRNSSIFALEENTGNAVDTNVISPKKPSRALLMHVLDGEGTSARSDVADCSNGANLVKVNLLKQSLILLCSEKSIRLYYLNHAIQGIKKVYSKKRLHGSCCWASTFHSPSGIGLILLFASGKIEIRSLPELALLKETSLRSFTVSTMQSSSNFDGVLCASSEGELVGVNGDQEIFFLTVLFRKNSYSLLESISEVYKKDGFVSQGTSTGVTTHKEKKMGIFSAVIRDIKGNKTKQGEDMAVVDSGADIAGELSVIFSTVNLPIEIENPNNLSVDKVDAEMNIDAIDLEDFEAKPKGQSRAMLDKQKLGKKLQAIKGKLKSKTTGSAETALKDGRRDEKGNDKVDDIKKRYGYPLTGDPSIPKMSESKLSENLRKLQVTVLAFLSDFELLLLTFFALKLMGSMTGLRIGFIEWVKNMAFIKCKRQDTL